MKNFSTLQIALGVSALLHAVVLTTRFVDPTSFNRVFKDKHGVAPSAWAKTAAAPPDSAENASQRAFRDDAGGATG